METRLQARRKAATAPSFTPVRGHALQRKHIWGGTSGSSGKDQACRKNRKAEMLQRKATHPSSFSSHPSEVPPIVHEVLRSSGQPLDSATRAFMEPRFGYDFSRVRMHADAKAAKSAGAINAAAYTVGSQVVFATGRYEPHALAGRKLIAHELAHTVQQCPQKDVPTITMSDASAEQEAPPPRALWRKAQCFIPRFKRQCRLHARAKTPRLKLLPRPPRRHSR